MSSLINRVILEGDVVRSTWAQGKDGGFFVTIKQEKHFNKFTYSSYFPIYANKPLANELAAIVEKNPNAHIIIEGVLKNYHSKKDNDWKITIQVEKLIQNKEKDYDHQEIIK